MNEYEISSSLFEDKEIFRKYINDLTTRQLIHRDDFDNSIEAFHYLMSNEIISQGLSTNIIIETANTVNKLNPYILDGFRVKGDYIFETDIKVPNARDLPSIVEGLITNYNLIKQHIAPIIIDDEIKETYDCLVYARDLDSLANLFRELSTRESKYIHSDFLNNQEINDRHY